MTVIPGVRLGSTVDMPMPPELARQLQPFAHRGEVLVDEPFSFTDSASQAVTVNTSVIVQAGNPYANSLGIGSIVLAIVGIFLACVPAAGLFLSGLACVLGLFGFIVASNRRGGTGIGFCVAGIAIGLIGTVLGFASLYGWIGLALAAGKVANEMEAAKAKSAVQVTTIGDTSGRTDAQTRVVVRDDKVVAVNRVTIGRVTGTELGSAGRSTQELLTIGVTVSNNSASKKLDYQSWATDLTSKAALTDSAGNSYKSVHFGLLGRVNGQVQRQEAVYPGKRVSDVLVFERPVAGVEWLFLDLPGDNFGERQPVRFKIPKAMIKTQPPEAP